MSMRDPETGQFVSADGSDVDYSDFEYQVFDVDLIIAAGGAAGNLGADAVYTIEPLGDAAGLDNNEVAEIVYTELHCGFENEDEEADQDVATTAEARGAMGINLPASQAAFLSATQTAASAQLDATVIRTNPDTNEDDVITNGNSKTDDRFLQFFRAQTGYPFDDETNGPGGGGSHENFYAEKNWRTLTGRGPVLDANDDLSVAVSANASDSVIGLSVNVRGHIVYDVAEMSDAGRRFSVPMSD